VLCSAPVKLTAFSGITASIGRLISS